MTEQETGPQWHSSSDVWKVINEQGKAIGQLQSGFAELRVRVDGGFASLANQISGILDSVEKQTEIQRREKPDTRGWIVAVLSMLVLLGSVGLLVIQPVQDELRVQEQRQWDLGHQAAYVKGYMEALEKMGHYPKQIPEHEHPVHMIEGER